MMLAEKLSTPIEVHGRVTKGVLQALESDPMVQADPCSLLQVQ